MSPAAKKPAPKRRRLRAKVSAPGLKQMQPLARHGRRVGGVQGPKQAGNESRFTGRRFWSFGARITCPPGAKQAFLADMKAHRGDQKRWTLKAWKAKVRQLRSQHVDIGHGGKRVGRDEQLKLPAKVTQETEVKPIEAAKELEPQHEGPSAGKGTIMQTGTRIDTDRQSDQHTTPTAQDAKVKGFLEVAAPVSRRQPLATGPPDSGASGVSAARVEGPGVAHLVLPGVDSGTPDAHVRAAAPAWTRKFKIKRKIGEGTFGTVYAATLLQPWPSFFSSASGTPPVIAIKVIGKKADDEEAMSSDRKEIRMLKSIGGNAHVVRLLAWRETHFDFQLFFKLYDGDLHTYIHPAGASLADAQLFCPQMLSAVRHIHSKGVVHRDIKPKNIFVQYQPLAVVLGDFGLATALGNLSGGGADPRLTPNVVTSWYRAPEVSLTPGLYSYPIDVWSLGVTIVELEQGQAPFQGRTD